MVHERANPAKSLRNPRVPAPPGRREHEGPETDYTFDFDDPEGHRLQFFCDMDQIGWDGKSRPKEQWKRFEVED